MTVCHECAGRKDPPCGPECASSCPWLPPLPLGDQMLSATDRSTRHIGIGAYVGVGLQGCTVADRASGGTRHARTPRTDRLQHRRLHERPAAGSQTGSERKEFPGAALPAEHTADASAAARWIPGPGVARITRTHHIHQADDGPRGTSALDGAAGFQRAEHCPDTVRSRDGCDAGDPLPACRAVVCREATGFARQIAQLSAAAKLTQPR